MRDLAFSDGDLAIVKGDLVVIDGGESLAQRVWVALSIHAGEWFLDLREGVPYLSLVFVKNPNLSLVDSVLRARILSVPGVARLSEYASEYDSVERSLRVNFRALMDSGESASETLTITGG